MWGTLLKATISAGKIIGGAKALKNVSDFVTEDHICCIFGLLSST